MNSIKLHELQHSGAPGEAKKTRLPPSIVGLGFRVSGLGFKV